MRTQNIGGNEIWVFTGIKHEYDPEMMENAIYKFIEYFDDIFGGVYVYFYVIIRDDFYWWSEADFHLM